MRIYAVWFVFLNDTATTVMYTYGHALSLHDALRIFSWLSILLGATMLPGAASSQEAATMPPIPPFECEAMVHYDREMKLPGYILPTSDRKSTRLNSSH